MLNFDIIKLMNRVITCATVLTPISCALDAPKSIEPEVPEATTTVSTFGKTKVIDGYISGANIFIDMNFNLEQDPNEPSAYEDIENQLYYFEVEDFSGIQDFTINCALARPRVAQIPVGAIDSDRGEAKHMKCIIFHTLLMVLENKASLVPM